MIEPISLPSAAAVSYGEGEVRHFSEGDGVNVPALSNPTRHLADRDNRLAEKLNAVIEEVNSKEQIVPLPIYRMVLPPSTDEIVANHRIPPGYEARVLNAIVSSTPNSEDIELNVLWSESFGNVSGTSIISTTSEVTGGTVFSPAGEFIVQIKNKGDVTLDTVASITLTMRPLTSIGGALLPAATVSLPGPTGAKGDKGDKGDTGATGPAGAGLVWQGAWVSIPATPYNPNDVVTYDWTGTSGDSSYRCQLAHTSDLSNRPVIAGNTYWEVLAAAGEAGPTGATGSSSLAFTSIVVNGTFTTDTDYVSAPTQGSYEGGGAISNAYPVELFETTVEASNGQGIAQLNGSVRKLFAGTGTLTLPVQAYGATVNWDTDKASLIVTSNGTVPVSVFESNGSYANGVYSGIENDLTGWTIFVPGTVPQKVSMLVVGSTAY